jgi:phage terminase large subunit-like protein
VTLPHSPYLVKPVEEMTRGEKVCAFIETYCIVPEGDLIGQPMRLLPFQRKFILDVYDNPFGTRVGILSIARKNGKTGLIGGLLLCHVAGPEAVANSQVVSGAMSKEQAGLVYDLAAKMVQLSPKLSKVIRLLPGTKRMVGLRKNVVYKALAAEGKTTHGLSPVLAILDEVGQVEGPRDKFIEAVVTAQGAYKNALRLVISTQAATDADLLSLWIDRALGTATADPRTICHLHTAPAECMLDDPKAWAAANPAMGIFRSIEDIKSAANDAMFMPASEASFRNLILNQRVSTSEPFVSQTVWDRNGGTIEPVAGRKIWAGLDLSAVHDLTALVGIDEEGGVHGHYWLPEEGIAQKALREHVPWDLWAKQGLITLMPGKAIEYEHVATAIRAFCDFWDVQKIGFDRWNYKFLKPWLLKAGFTEEELDELFVEFGQGTASMTPALRELEVRLVNGSLAHGQHQVLNMCRHNAVVVGNSGARKFDKAKARGRIDGMVALANAAGVLPATNEGDDMGEFFRNPVAGTR